MEGLKKRIRYLYVELLVKPLSNIRLTAFFEWLKMVSIKP